MTAISSSSGFSLNDNFHWKNFMHLRWEKKNRKGKRIFNRLHMNFYRLRLDCFHDYFLEFLIISLDYESDSPTFIIQPSHLHGYKWYTGKYLKTQLSGGKIVSIMIFTTNFTRIKDVQHIMYNDNTILLYCQFYIAN